jgi:hypothetical protein
MQNDQPLILTLTLDEASFSFFNNLRNTYFPPARNYLSAHLTLFHHLPPNKPTIPDGLEKWCRETAPLPLHVTEVKSIGRGVAYKIDCPELVGLHSRMQDQWKDWLTPQDRQKRWPHITVQNKVSPAEAKETLAILQASFQPFTATGTGFSLWVYEGGPWQFVKNFPFTGR